MPLLSKHKKGLYDTHWLLITQLNWIASKLNSVWLITNRYNIYTFHFYRVKIDEAVDSEQRSLTRCNFFNEMR